MQHGTPGSLREQHGQYSDNLGKCVQPKKTTDWPRIALISSYLMDGTDIDTLLSATE
jgi:hypothetical protein